MLRDSLPENNNCLTEWLQVESIKETEMEQAIYHMLLGLKTEYHHQQSNTLTTRRSLIKNFFSKTENKNESSL
ncbi:hypothetical protein K5E_03850 [Enterococcus thailandicus]|uniref:Uncharacterized protein n=1 Tax=Enterococcus thailandicus TaxID=417368 RepID=A0A510WBT4_ENTTH|nr:hypothetical protein ETH01_09460 [Enterococcus thailandicus]GMB99754.1 hypothetical protein K2F_00140 [Enterococcus thailandicus]GMC08247.1 hypothetical protein K5E_03850 [Enterococcus thailandicus]